MVGCSGCGVLGCGVSRTSCPMNPLYLIAKAKGWDAKKKTKFYGHYRKAGTSPFLTEEERQSVFDRLIVNEASVNLLGHLITKHGLTLPVDALHVTPVGAVPVPMANTVFASPSASASASASGS